ncbi:MAG TPA: sortase, partial [Anaerolineales bacterium]|nr:sortase [Anaerolineales bacterium]
TTLKRETSTGPYALDGTIDYEIVVTNTGNVTLTGVTVSDNSATLGTCTPPQPATLAPGEAITCPASHVVTQDDFNNGSYSNTATGDSDQTEPSDSSVTVTLVQTPAVNITKSPANQSVASGGTANFTLTVTNIGNVVLTGVTVSDPLCTTGPTYTGGDTNNDNQLQLTETWTYSCSTANVTAPFTNTATVSTSEGASDSDTANVTVNNPVVGLAKSVAAVSKVSTGTWQVEYLFVVENLGNVTLLNLQVTDNLNSTFPLPTTFSVQSISSTDFTVNTAYDGDIDTNMLAGTDSLSIGATGTFTVVVHVVPTEDGPFNNTATATAEDADGTNVSDISDNGIDPDPNGNGDPTEAGENDLTPVSFGPNLFDPPFGIKDFDDSGLPVLRWTMVWINDSNLVALNSEVSDPIPGGTTYIASGAPSGYAVPAGAPAGSSNLGVSCTPDAASVSTTTTLCYYEGPTGPYPRGRIIWQGTLGPDFGATNASEATNEISISFTVDVPGSTMNAQNIGTISADLNGDGSISGSNEIDVASALATWSREQITELPQTGFAPGVVTALPVQPLNKTYQALGSVWLEIPALGVRTNITGVPATEGEWDVSWLNSQAGWLQGTAFPSFSGNSVITGHVVLSNGEPGPFVNLGNLRWNNTVVVHAFGMRYIYKVQTNQVIQPDDLTALEHEEQPWISLLTCRGYDEQTGTYDYRVLVRAVLVDIEPESYLFE